MRLKTNKELLTKRGYKSSCFDRGDITYCKPINKLKK